VKLERVAGKEGYRDFARFGARVYAGNAHYRGTQGSVEKLLLLGPTVFHRHVRIRMYLVVDLAEVVARFALIHDTRLPDHVQVGFFEARPGLKGLWDLVRGRAVRDFPGIPRVVVGINGHVNYGAALLLDRFDQAPVFGLPYSHDYYPGYFATLRPHGLVSFRFTMDGIHDWVDGYGDLGRMEGITLRFMDKKNIAADIAHYTRLNNACFRSHPFWADRDEAEDLELFHPFRHLLENENLIFAEHEGRPVAFYLWYPDFNQLVSGPRDLGLRDWVKLRLRKHIDTLRFTQVGVLPAYRNRPLSLAMIRESLPAVARAGHEYAEGGFIFEVNRGSMALARRILRRSFGREVQPYRRYAVFEGELT
jgi:hypothetical protein